MKINFKNTFLISAAVFLLSFNPPDKKRKFIDPANMDMTIKPGDNFFLYANGNWIRNNPVPPSKTRWGAFGIIDEENTIRLRQLLEDEAKNPNPGKFIKVADYYLSGMDTASIEKVGYQPIVQILEKINTLIIWFQLFPFIVFCHWWQL